MLQRSAGILEQSMGARNRVGIGLPYRPARLHRLAELTSWSQCLDSLKIKNTGTGLEEKESTRDYWMIYRGPGFFAVARCGSSPTPFPSFPPASCLSFSVFLCVAGQAYWREKGGRGEVMEEIQITWRRERLILCKSFNTLWKVRSLLKILGVASSRW
jgi:hypothetical protein